MRIGDLLLLQAAFDGFVGYSFVFDPASLFDGYQPATGFAMYAIESFGFSNIFYALLLACMRRNRTVQAFNALYNGFWTAHLANTFLTAGRGWRDESALASGSFAVPPLVVHAIFAVVSLWAMMTNDGGAKKKKAY